MTEMSWVQILPGDGLFFSSLSPQYVSIQVLRFSRKISFAVHLRQSEMNRHGLSYKKSTGSIQISSVMFCFAKINRRYFLSSRKKTSCRFRGLSSTSTKKSSARLSWSSAPLTTRPLLALEPLNVAIEAIAGGISVFFISFVKLRWKT